MVFSYGVLEVGVLKLFKKIEDVQYQYSNLLNILNPLSLMNTILCAIFLTAIYVRILNQNLYGFIYAYACIISLMTKHKCLLHSKHVRGFSNL